MSSPSAALGPSWRSRLGWTVLALLLAVYFYVPVHAVLDTSLDVSNYASYTRFAAEQLQFGTEVVPMAGPYGFVVYGWVYNGDLYVTRLFLEFLTKLVFAGFVLWVFWRTRKTVTGWAWLIANLIVLPTTTELTYDFPVLYAALFLLFERPRWWLSLLTVGFLAFLALCKGTQLIFTLAVLAVVCAEAAWRRAWRDLVVIVFGFSGALVMFWSLAGQSLGNLPAYIRNIQELSTGYLSGMALQETALTFGVGLASLVVIGSSLVLLLAPHWRQPSLIAGAVVVVGFTFLQWKHGFVRADGHVFLFFHYCIVGGLTVLLLDALAGVARRNVAARVIIYGVGVMLALYGSGERIGDRFKEYGRVVARNVPTSLLQILQPFRDQQRFEATLATNRIRYALPETAERVGEAPIGFFGYETGYLTLNGLRERPSPVAGGGPFSVFTPHLQQLDRQHVISPATRPEYYLVKLQTIDVRFIPQDDAPAFNAILQTYRPVLSERGMLLFQALPTFEVPESRELQRVKFKLGDVVPVPPAPDGEMVLASFALPSSAAGTVRAALYKGPIVTLHVTVAGSGATLERRIIPSMASAPFIVSPVLEKTEDLLALYALNAGNHMTSLQVTADPAHALEGDNCSVTFYAQKRPKPLPPEQLAEIEGQFSYHMANRTPLAIESANARAMLLEDRMVQVIEPPGTIIFALRENDRELVFDYGFDAEAYTRGTTDGADFIAEYLRPGADPERIFYSRREPRTVEADRGRQHARVWLPIVEPGARIQLRTHGGRTGAADWDWTYFDNVRLLSGPFRVEQFPGFHVAPTAVEGGAPRMIKHEGRDMLLLGTPGKLYYELSGTESGVRFSGGFVAGAYTDGNTDGAEFIVEAQRPDGPAETVFKRWLQPKTVEADRGIQSFDVPLPELPPHTKLILHLSPGPHNEPSWDWTVIGEVQLEQRR